MRTCIQVHTVQLWDMAPAGPFIEMFSTVLSHTSVIHIDDLKREMGVVNSNDKLCFRRVLVLVVLKGLRQPPLKESMRANMVPMRCMHAYKITRLLLPHLSCKIHSIARLGPGRVF